MSGGPKKTRRAKPPAEPATVERGSGNVFADLGVPEPELALAKACLVRRIRDVIADHRLTQVMAADVLGIDQPKVSALVRGRTEGYTFDRLLRFLTALGQRVEISIRPREAADADGVVVVT